MPPVISVENLSKSYLIGHQGTRDQYTSLRDTLSKHAKNFTRRTLDTLRGKQMLHGDTTEEFWALKDLSFEVKQGEVLGIIGRNGAGKSTLLKVLSRITEPTSGKVTIRGRVASLLEVGTGFHPELSGRENIYLNGAILGMSRKEIKSKFDEIVDFAGVERFLDTPVKRYSSGMYVRLAFSVAAHLDPEILIVDEVLAVGDREFQKKCMGKMQNVSEGGRTILFVSHNMDAIESLCNKAIVLNKGTLLDVGSVASCLDSYFSRNTSNLENFERLEMETEDGNLLIESFHIKNNEGSTNISFETENTIIVVISGRNNIENDLCALGFSLKSDRLNKDILWTFNIDKDPQLFPKGDFSYEVEIPNGILNDGDYELELLAGIYDHKWMLAPGSSKRVIYFSIKRQIAETNRFKNIHPTILHKSIDWRRK